MLLHWHWQYLLVVVTQWRPSELFACHRCLLMLSWLHMLKDHSTLFLLLLYTCGSFLGPSASAGSNTVSKAVSKDQKQTCAWCVAVYVSFHARAAKDLAARCGDPISKGRQQVQM